ncbi:hypothetical protein [Natronococcus jeotgali]|uniref:DUF8131 domain-containing protein n=1 Tax=Natronococcus jeotgali DSM 18795 TaxID=1227498 RepID=L9XI19_9EURY|nr:hypothetical protein [Natronococcus jeotgali]ELY61036.1 hypothetical protein C492_09860 [Natronococcus jeotgali DSM 18795]
MTLEMLSPRYAAAVGLLAIVPVVVYGVTNSGLAGVVSAINVAVIVGSLYLAMSPVVARRAHRDDGNGTVG